MTIGSTERPGPAGLDHTAALRRHIAATDPALLLASLVAITGDRARGSQFLPHLTHTIALNGASADLAPAAVADFHDWAVDVLSDPDLRERAAGTELDDEIFTELATAMIGLAPEPGSLPFLREQSGFDRFVRTVPRTATPPADFTLAIVGGGMAGIAMAIAAKQENIGFRVFEKTDGVGGVWRQNNYPGVAVDTPSTYYSFSFEVNPEWTHQYPLGGQYLDYLDRAVDTYGVRDHFTFGANVEGMCWDSGRDVWILTVDRGGEVSEFTANAVVTAAGYLTRPQFPNVDRDVFEGESFHTAQWDHSVSLRGKRVAVVGTGATSVQVVDAIVDDVQSLTLFQRQPHWVMPSIGRGEISEADLWMLANVPTFEKWTRLRTFMTIGDVNYPSVRFDPDWAARGDLSISEANDRLLQVARGYLQTSFADRPDLLEKMTPNFAPHGKRIIRDPGNYFGALKRDNASVVTTGVAKIVPEGIVDGDGVLHELDVILYATGFTLDFLSGWDIRGRDGVTLREAWGDEPVAYNGCLVPGFPNLFVTSGPHASAGHGGGHNFTVEAVVHYIVECLQHLFESDARALDATPEALDRWATEMRDTLADSVWVREQRANTYYRNASGTPILASPLTMEDYWNRLRRPDPADITLS